MAIKMIKNEKTLEKNNLTTKFIKHEGNTITIQMEQFVVTMECLRIFVMDR